MNTKFTCPIEATISLIGGKYKALIIWHLMTDLKRYSELRRLIPQATPKMLTQQLRELEKDNLIHREVYPVVPPKVEYSLTQFGQSMIPILRSMFDWGDDYMKSHGMQINHVREELNAK